MSLLTDVAGGCHVDPLLRLTAANLMQCFGNKYEMLLIPLLFRRFPYLSPFSSVLKRPQLLLSTLCPKAVRNG